MCVLAYTSSKIDLFSLQEFILLKPRGGEKKIGLRQVYFNLLMDVHDDNASLFLIQRGNLFGELENLTLNVIDPDDWMNELINKEIVDRAIKPKGDDLDVWYAPHANNSFAKADFKLDRWPGKEEATRIQKEEGTVPFVKITLSGLPRKRCIARIGFANDYGIAATHYQRHFQIQGPGLVESGIQREVGRIRDSNLKDAFDKIYWDFQHNRCQRQKYDVFILGHPRAAHFLDDGHTYQHQETFTFPWPNPKKGGENSIVYSFSPEELDFNIRMVSELKPENDV